MSYTHSYSIRLPEDVIKTIERMGKGKAQFIRDAITNALLKLSDTEKLIENDIKKIEKEKEELLLKLQEEKERKKAYYEKYKEVAQRIYIKLFKYYKSSYVQHKHFISTEESSNLLLDYVKLTGENIDEVESRLKKEILNEVNNGTGI